MSLYSYDALYVQNTLYYDIIRLFHVVIPLFHAVIPSFHAAFRSKTPRSATEIFAHLALSKQTKNRKLYITELLESGIMAITIPDKPHDMHQKYITIEKR